MSPTSSRSIVRGITPQDAPTRILVTSYTDVRICFAKIRIVKEVPDASVSPNFDGAMRPLGW